MNFAKTAPFLLFALAFLACLLSRIDLSSPEGPSQCYIEVLPPTDDLQHEAVIKNQENALSRENSLTTHQKAATHLISRSLSSEGYRKTCPPRLLQTNPTTGNYFIIGSVVVFQAVILMSRNLILVGMVTNTIDLFLPLLLLTECFLMVGLWTCQKHYLAVLFGGVFGSYWDFFNAIRLMVQPGIQAGTLPQLAQYGLSPLVIFNLSGELFVALLLLVFIVLSRVSAACLRHERLRRMAACLRPVWNGYFFAILPRVATFTGLHWRLVGVGAGYDVINGAVCGLLSGVIVFYFIALLVQSRRANSKVERLEDGAEGLGLVRRIDIRRDFEFDCLRYSAIYFPCMNYLRVVAYCLPIGLCWDYYYLSYGGAITAQLGILMAEVSSSSYLLRRDRVLFPLQNFMLLIVHLAIITVGLAESVQHSEVSEVAETLLFAVLIFVLGSSLLGVGVDAWGEAQHRCDNSLEAQGRGPNLEGESAQNFTRQLGKSSTICDVKRQEEIDSEEASYNRDDVIEDSSASFKNTEKPLKLKIKKVRKGKVI